jgi:hypothetical protein
MNIQKKKKKQSQESQNQLNFQTTSRKETEKQNLSEQKKLSSW